jgi:Protein of unknown function (DUF3108)
MGMLRMKIILLLLASCLAGPLLAEEFHVACPSPLPVSPTNLPRSDTYKNTPFKAGEVSEYAVSWMGMLAGYGTIEIQAPQKVDSVWHRSYHVEARTGDWFKGIYAANDSASATIRPWDEGVTNFYLEQQEGKFLGNSFVLKKWLTFSHDKCKVLEKTEHSKSGNETVERDLQYGAMDAIGATLKLRTFDYVPGKIERFLVYTSEKNWFLEARPIGIEEITVPAGTFKAMKLKLHTFIGKEMQQKGDVFVWVANDPQRTMVQVQGDIKIGSVFMRLSKYTPSPDAK